MDLEYKVQILLLKEAALILDALASGLKVEEARSQTKQIAWAVTWAVHELTRIDEAQTKKLKAAKRQANKLAEHR